MKREEILKMARECDLLGHFEVFEGSEIYESDVKAIEKFAKLIAAHEREECAKESERMVMYPGERQEAPAHETVWHAAKSIRARK